ncbi:MAG: tripartite tricarboxylate transporter substrate binding protein, partial [Rhodoferax sp.]|nr:tripartite tricarboxylate transporter substrate binding protein [Rhodoferax sp.]
MPSLFRTVLLTAAAALGGLGATAATAQSWQPTRNVEYIVPAGPGAALDTAARELKDLIDRMKLSPMPMLVSNKPGGAGM